MVSQELLDVIKLRRAVMPTQYNDEKISDKDLSQILESANWAPTHKRTEPWRLTVLRNDAKSRLAKFLVQKYRDSTAEELQSERKINGITEKCERSDVIILIKMNVSHLLPEWEELAAVSMAVQNMWLMCACLGIGSYWSSPGSISQIHEFTPLEENEKCLGIFYMGKLAHPLMEGTRKPMAEKVQYLDK